MGNCIHIEQQTNYGCWLCQSELDVRYIYCPYCNKRFHSRCIM